MDNNIMKVFQICIVYIQFVDYFFIKWNESIGGWVDYIKIYICCCRGKGDRINI